MAESLEEKNQNSLYDWLNKSAKLFLWQGEKLPT